MKWIRHTNGKLVVLILVVATVIIGLGYGFALTIVEYPIAAMIVLGTLVIGIDFCVLYFEGERVEQERKKLEADQ